MNSILISFLTPLVSSYRHEVFDAHINLRSGGSMKRSFVIFVSLESLFAIVLSFFYRDRLGRADLCTDGIAHISTAIALDSHFHRGRGVDDPERADHDTHPAGDTGRFMNVNHAGLRIPAHGSIGAGFQAWSVLAVSALEGEGFSFHINTRDRPGVFMNRLGKFLRYGGDLRSTPEFTLMATRTLVLVNH
jgi:hypothetical protein